MFEITKVYRQEIPAMRFIGKMYGDEDSVNGNFGRLWMEWLSTARFNIIEAGLVGGQSVSSAYENGASYLGMMRRAQGEPFEYWLGELTPAGTSIPKGFGYVDFDAGALGVCWICGKEDEIHNHEEICAEKIRAAGMEILPEKPGENAYWFFERYVHPRFTTPDKNGNVTLDLCYFVK